MLVGFQRCKARAGRSRVVKFSLPGEAFAFVDEAGEEKVEPG